MIAVVKTKMRIHLKGGALQLVLMVSMLIFVLLLSFILLDQYHRGFDSLTILAHRKHKLLNESITYCLQKNDFRSPVSYSSHGISATVTTQKWGVFRLLTSTLNDHKINPRMALVGSRPLDSTLLTLADTGFPLIFAGKSAVFGDVKIPGRQWRFASIEGNSSPYLHPITGNVEPSTGSLPAVSVATETLEETKGMSGNHLKDELNHSFAKDPLIINGQNLTLENKKWSGNIIVSAVDTLVVFPSCRLQHLQLRASVVILKEGVKGSFQVFAGKQISVESNCHLQYPSVLMVDASNFFSELPKSSPTPAIYIQTGAHVEGGIIYKGHFQDRPRAPTVYLESQTQLIGQIYTQGALDLRGKVYGRVYAHQMVTHLQGTLYLGSIYQGEVHPFAESLDFAGIPFENSESHYIAQWLP